MGRNKLHNLMYKESINFRNMLFVILRNEMSLVISYCSYESVVAKLIILQMPEQLSFYGTIITCDFVGTFTAHNSIRIESMYCIWWRKYH